MGCLPYKRPSSKKGRDKKSLASASRPPKKYLVNDPEEIVARAIKELIAEKIFDAYARAKHSDNLDTSHIDIAAINFNKEKLFVLQVKSKAKIKMTGETPAERHQRKYPSIPVLEIKRGEDRNRAVKKAKAAIKKIYAENPSAEKVLDKKVLQVIAEKFHSQGYDYLFFV